MASRTVYFGDLLTALERMGLAERLGEAEARAGAGESVAQVAAAFGMEWQPRPATVEPGAAPPMGQPEPPPPAPPPARPLEAAPAKPRAEFWTVLQRHTRRPEEAGLPPAELRDVPPTPGDKWQLKGEPLRGAPLMPWSRLWPLLRRVLGQFRPSRSPDLPRLVRALALGRPLHRLPRRLRRAWCPEVTVLVDRRPALSPFLDDFADTIARIRSLRGAGGLRIVPVRAEGFALLSEDTLQPLPLPPRARAAALLALGDLGQYAGGLMASAWMLWGRRARRAGFTPWALCPCPPDRWSPAVAHAWNLVGWDRHIRPPLDGFGQRARPWAPGELEVAVKRRSQQLHGLLRLVSPAIRVERGLLRDVRFLLDHTAADAGTEYDAFQSPDALGTGAGFSLTPARQQQLRVELGQAPNRSLLAAMLALLRRHHAYSASIFGAEELEGLMACLPPELRPLLAQCGLLTPETEAQISLHWRQLAADLLAGRTDGGQQAMRGYALRALSRVEESTAASPAKQVIWGLNHLDHTADLPPAIAPEIMAFLAGRRAERETHVLSVAGGLCLGTPQLQSGIPLAQVASDREMVALRVEPEAGSGGSTRCFARPWQDAPALSEEDLRRAGRIQLDAGLETLELVKMPRPPWAARMWQDRRGLHAEVKLTDAEIHQFDWELQPVPGSGEGPRGRLAEQGGWTAKSKPAWAEVFALDAFGLRAEFRLRSVPFVLRWIPPGRFLMGSPEDEPGRYDNEGPRHEVRITRGFWLGETPVTQAQWRAVVEAAGAQPGLLNRLLGRETLNPAPSYFQGPAELPVEQVAWEDCARFCRLLEALLLDGPGFRLPTEAQWEFACRAGAENPPFAGPLRLEGDVISPDLDPFAWYGGNSGRELEVKNPQDSRAWLGQANGSPTAGTHRVKLKQPNASGLYDMLGNVWEWCRDTWDEAAYAKRPEGTADPLVDAGSSASRVVRGGAWISLARDCRAAFRNRYHPVDRVWYLGLRLSAGQELQAAEPRGAERPLPERRSRARRAGGSPPA